MKGVLHYFSELKKIVSMLQDFMGYLCSRLVIPMFIYSATFVFKVRECYDMFVGLGGLRVMVRENLKKFLLSFISCSFP